jgi:glutaredoxin 1
MSYVIYGAPGCGFCLEAKRLLTRLEIDYTAIDISELDEHEKKQLQEIAGIQFRTVPQIFETEGNHMDYVGGFKELKIRVG